MYILPRIHCVCSNCLHTKVETPRCVYVVRMRENLCFATGAYNSVDCVAGNSLLCETCKSSRNMWNFDISICRYTYVRVCAIVTCVCLYTGHVCVCIVHTRVCAQYI